MSREKGIPGYQERETGNHVNLKGLWVQAKEGESLILPEVPEGSVCQGAPVLCGPINIHRYGGLTSGSKSEKKSKSKYFGTYIKSTRLG